MSEELPMPRHYSDRGCPDCGSILCGTKRTQDGEVVAWGHTCLMVQLRKAHNRIAELEKEVAGSEMTEIDLDGRWLCKKCRSRFRVFVPGNDLYGHGVRHCPNCGRPISRAIPSERKEERA